jgi:hypothetical protein
MRTLTGTSALTPAPKLTILPVPAPDAEIRSLAAALVHAIQDKLVASPNTPRELVLLRAAAVDFLDADELRALRQTARQQIVRVFGK